jgi:RNA polymerase-binding transcription factor DksA
MTGPTYSSEQLVLLEERINDKLAEVSQQIDDIDDQMEELNQPHADEFDVANAMMEKKQLISMRENAVMRKKGLEINLTKIRTGEIGICVETRESIPFERMMAVPHTSRCIQGKQINNLQKPNVLHSLTTAVNNFHERAMSEIGVFTGDEEEITDFEQDTTLPVIKNTPPKFASQGMKTRRR